MFVDLESLVLGWSDYVLFVGVLIVFATFRVIVHSKRFIRRRLRWMTMGNSRWSLDEDEMNSYVEVEDKEPFASFGTTTMLLFLSTVSASTEAYGMGLQIIYLLIPNILASIFLAHFYMPIFHELEVNSVQEYLEARFNRSVSILSLVSAVLQMIFQMAFILCIPALAMAQLTAYPLWLSVLLIGLMATSYTGAGNFRLEIWANVVQVLLALIAPVLIVVLGIMHIGGFSAFLSYISSTDLNTLNNFNANPLKDYSFFTIVFGGFGMLLSISAVNPIEVEQYASTIVERKAKVGIYIRSLIQCTFYGLLVLCGLVAYGVLFGCNPQIIQLTSHPDQTLSAAVVVLGSHRVTVKGFLLGALVVSAVSAMTSISNSGGFLIARVLIAWSNKLSMKQRRPADIGRWISFLICLLSIPIACGVIQVRNSLIRFGLSFIGAFGGPLFAITCLGMFLPWITNLGAMSGLILSQISGVCLLVYKVYSYVASGNGMVYHNTTETCSDLFPLQRTPLNMTETMGEMESSLFYFSFWYIPSICFLVGLVFSIVMSVPGKFNADTPVDEKYIAWPTRTLLNSRNENDANSQLSEGSYGDDDGYM